MHENCKCFHHWVTKILVVLAWLAAIGFWWVGRSGDFVWGMDADNLFKNVVILSLLAFGTVFCGCCGKSKMMNSKMSGSGMCTHQSDCKCGDCSSCR